MFLPEVKCTIGENPGRTWTAFGLIQLTQFFLLVWQVKRNELLQEGVIHRANIGIEKVSDMMALGDDELLDVLVRVVRLQKRQIGIDFELF